MKELFDGESCLGEDSAEGSLSDLLVIGNDDPAVRIVSPQDHVAAFLTTEHKTGEL